MSPMKISNIYTENMQNFFVSLMVPSNAYNKLNQHLRGSDRQDIWLLPPWIPGASLDLVSHKKNICFEDHAIESAQALNGMGDKTEDFIESSHQYGACKDRLTQGLRDYRQKNESQHKAENQ